MSRGLGVLTQRDVIRRAGVLSALAAFAACNAASPAGSSHEGTGGSDTSDAAADADAGSDAADASVDVGPSDGPAASDADAGCSDDACVLCQPGSSRCEANAVVVCASDGLSELWPQPCDLGDVCVASAGTASCVSAACASGQSFCATSGEVVETCTDAGVSVPLQDCAASGAVCVAGACVPVVCTPLALFCSAGEIRLCSAKGDSSKLVQTCTTAQYCDPAVTPAACKTKLCAPNAPVCNGNVATSCNALGSDYASSGVDCSLTAQVCSAGQCLTPVCTPGALACNQGSVVKCNPDGLGTSLQTACKSSEYCDPASPSCKPLVCTPNQPVCTATVLTTCDALGAGPLPGGVDCAPSYCSSGSCTSALFFEDFEDGDYAGWWDPGGTDYQRWVTSTSGADGTTHSFCMNKLSGNYAYGGETRMFSALEPSYVSWWVRPTTKYSSFFELSPVSGSLWLVLQHYDEYGQIVLTRLTKPNIAISHAVGTWYHTELRNIDWQARTYDYYIDGALVAAGVDFEHQGAQFEQIDFYHYGAGTGGCIDQILMK